MRFRYLTMLVFSLTMIGLSLTMKALNPMEPVAERREQPLRRWSLR